MTSILDHRRDGPGSEPAKRNRMLADVQGRPDARGVALDRVGVTDLAYPLVLRGRDDRRQTVTARLELTVGLDHRQRGAHFSSLVESLHRDHRDVLDLDGFGALAREVRRQQDARGIPNAGADVRARFTYFVAKAAPASGLSALVPYECAFRVLLGAATGVDGQADARSTSVRVPVATLCPCSLEISEVGAHNQRAVVTVELWQGADDRRRVWLEDLIDTAEASASTAVYSLLKRADEKAVTEAMFGAPRFVEDVVRDVVVRLRSAFAGARYTVQCEGYESIHAHNAYAEANGVC